MESGARKEGHDRQDADFYASLPLLMGGGRSGGSGERWRPLCRPLEQTEGGRQALPPREMIYLNERDALCPAALAVPARPGARRRSLTGQAPP